MAILNLSSPWVDYYRKIEAMFRHDADVTVIYDEENVEIRLYVQKPEKAVALEELLPEEKTFGNVTLNITVIPANGIADPLGIDIYENAFNGNAALSFIRTVSGIFPNPIHYIVFKNEVVQYFNDSLADVHGLCSTLYQDIAKEIFGEANGIFYCTDVPNSPSKTIGV